MRSRAVAAALGLALALAGTGRAEELSADAWYTRVAQALRVADAMSARAHVEMDEPAGTDDWSFDLELLRQPWRDGVRTVMEMRETGDSTSIVNELVVHPGEPLTNWYWDIRKRRWISVKGFLGTDRFADTLFRYEDLWLTDPSERRRGSVRMVEEDGRRLVEIASEPYHYYARVEMRVDPETALPVRVRFFDHTGAPIREQLFESLVLVDGRPFPTVVTLRDLTGGGRATITYRDVRFPPSIPASFFDLSVLHDRLTKGVDPVPLEAVPDRAPDAPPEAEASPGPRSAGASGGA